MAKTEMAPLAPEQGSASLLDLLAVLVRRRAVVVGVMIVSTSITLLVALLFPATYISTTTFVPEVSSSNQLPAGFANLAGQVGLSLSSEVGTSPRFFADVLRSREMMDRILQTRFADPHGSTIADSSSLMDLLRIDGDNVLERLEEGRNTLSKKVTARVDAETSIITLSVKTPNRDLSAAVANTFIQYLNEFNTKSRQLKAREQRAFVERRVDQSAEELQDAERELQSFYESNRSWQQSPQLLFREGKIRRRVELVQQIYAMLNLEYEKSRIEEVNDTPGITIIDTAVAMQQRSSPRYGLIAAMAIVLGTFIGLAVALGLEYLERLKVSDPVGFAQLGQLVPRRWRKEP
jgi:uncharacterized protein involved in exopolysaccharide biosynthesis